MIIVTGAAGFIGSNIIKGLNQQGVDNIIAVDDLTDGHKFTNLVGLSIADYIDKDEFLDEVQTGIWDKTSIDAIFHQGACSTTTEWNGKYMMANNYSYSQSLLHLCQQTGAQFIYASSAAVYGGSNSFQVDPKSEKPLNVYGYSKLLFDNYVRNMLPESQAQVVGLRYFNVYGPGEQHKGSQASVAFHHYQQMQAGDKIKLFAAYDGYSAGEQRRDFIYIDDVVAMNLWFWQNPNHSGIFNCGTGRSQPFNDIANTVLDWYGRGSIDYIDFPEHLKGHYQSLTQADMSDVQSLGYQHQCLTVEQGVRDYLNRLAQGQN